METDGQCCPAGQESRCAPNLGNLQLSLERSLLNRNSVWGIILLVFASITFSLSTTKKNNTKASVPSTPGLQFY